MTDQIFVSHSREDTELLEEFDRVFGKVGLKQYRASFEDQQPPVSEELKNQIVQSNAVFVVLGRQAQAKTHTMIWIGWEAGVAVQNNIPVWIFEDIQSRVKLPIPSFTDYVLWDSRDDDQKRILRDVIEDEFVKGNQERPGSFSAPTTKDTRWGVSNRNSANVRESEVVQEVKGIRCPYESCGEMFAIRFKGPDEFNCPSCRQAIVFEEAIFS